MQASAPSVYQSGAAPSPWLAPFRLPGRLLRHREVLFAMARRDLAARFRGSVLGWLWPLIHPVTLFLVYLFLFSGLLQLSKNMKIEGVADATNFFAVYLFSGIVVWTAFQDAVQRSATVVLDNDNLIKKMVFPAEILPLSIAFSATVIQLFGIAVFTGIMYVGGFWPGPHPAKLLVIPILMVLQIFFAYGLGMLVATLQVFLRDTAQILVVLLTFWMFLTPTFWSPEAIRNHEDVSPEMLKFLSYLEWNPMYHLIESYRAVLIDPRADWLQFATWKPVLIFAGMAIPVYLVGAIFFEAKRERFSDEI